MRRDDERREISVSEQGYVRRRTNRAPQRNYGFVSLREHLEEGAIDFGEQPFRLSLVAIDEVKSAAFVVTELRQFVGNFRKRGAAADDAERTYAIRIERGRATAAVLSGPKAEHAKALVAEHGRDRDRVRWRVSRG